MKLLYNVYTIYVLRSLDKGIALSNQMIYMAKYFHIIIIRTEEMVFRFSDAAGTLMMRCIIYYIA